MPELYCSEEPSAESAESDVLRDLPLYVCHKKVRALKLQKVKIDGPIPRNQESDGMSATLVPVEKGFKAVRVTKGYLEKHNPRAGGYYVLYQDGYKSYSPADAFEGGYTKI